jgi:hypothetical protein
MTTPINDQLLDELGFGYLDPSERSELKEYVTEMLQLRTGMRLTEGLSEGQLEEFEKEFSANATDTAEDIARKQAGVTGWLESNHANYRDVVAEEFEKLKQDVRAQAGKPVTEISL